MTDKTVSAQAIEEAFEAGEVIVTGPACQRQAGIDG